MSNRTPEQRAKYNENRRQRVATDPEYRAKRLANHSRWRERNLERDRQRKRENYASNAEAEKARAKEWRQTNPEKAKEQARARYRANRQNGLCAICSVSLKDLPPKQVHADHCHTTKQPRGVLCHSCNHGLGKFRDDPAILRAAIAYLETPPLADYAPD